MAIAPRSSTIGIVGSYIPERLKQMALLFDRIAIPNLRYLLECRNLELTDDAYKQLANEIEFLEENGIAFEPKHLLDGIEDWGHSAPRDEVADLVAFVVASDNLGKSGEDVRRVAETYKPGTFDEIKHVILQFADDTTSRVQFQARALAKKMQRIDHLDAVPIFEAPMIVPKQIEHEYQTIPATVAEVVLGRIPVPSDSTPWERIIDFRNEPDNKGYLKGLRSWMNRLVHERNSGKEIEDELDWLIFQQRQHLRAHKIDFWQGMFGAAFVATAEFVEDLTKLKFGKVAQGIVTVSDGKTKLLRAELESPVKEINYILRAQREFGS